MSDDEGSDAAPPYSPAHSNSDAALGTRESVYLPPYDLLGRNGDMTHLAAQQGRRVPGSDQSRRERPGIGWNQELELGPAGINPFRGIPQFAEIPRGRAAELVISLIVVFFVVLSIINSPLDFSTSLRRRRLEWRKSRVRGSGWLLQGGGCVSRRGGR